MTAHALLGASGAHRWLNCTPSARLEEGYADTTSDYAKEGTLAHELCELKLERYLTPMPTRTYNAKLKKIKENDLYGAKEMEDATDNYLEHIKELMISFDSKPFVVVEAKVKFSDYVPDGFGTVDCLIISGDTLYVRDFKYGAGVPVSAEINPQMMLYALGAYLENSLFYDIKKVNMGIIQPRINNNSVFEMELETLLEWAKNVVKPSAERAYKGEGEFNPSADTCKFCRAKAQCRARGEANLALEFEKIKGDEFGNVFSNAEMGSILKRAQDLVKWAKDIEEYCLSACLRGEEIQGWKAVEGRGIRAFTDTDLAIDTLIANGVAEEILFERKQLTLAQIEKTVGKETFEIVKDFVVKPPGKPTLVSEADKREPISNVTNASDDFKQII